MSIGDIKGARRRMKARIASGLAQRPKNRSVAKSIEINRLKALNMAKARGSK